MIDFNVEWDWGWDAPSLSCVTSDPRFTCQRDRTGQWDVRDIQRPPA
jgi:hypothetical protein